jgi:glutamate carboxypeptidase
MSAGDTQDTAREVQEMAHRAFDDLALLVAISSQTGDAVGAEEMVRALTSLLPEGASHERLPCSTAGCAPDLLARLSGTGEGRLLLLGHLDTVMPREAHQPLGAAGSAWHGTGAFDMKGGLVIACALMRALSRRPESFAEATLLVTCDEEVRSVPLLHRDAPSLQSDAVLCFEGGERHGGHEAVVLRRKSASSLRVDAYGRAAHSGASAKEGASALDALASLARRLTVLAIEGEEEVSVVPTEMHAGEGLNIVPSYGWLHCDVRAYSTQTARNMLALVPERMPGCPGVRLEARLTERFPAMDSRQAALTTIQAASDLIGQPILGVSRGGASDTCFFADRIPVAIDGLGPLGGSDHSPAEHVLGPSFGPRLALALALTASALSEARSPLERFDWVRPEADDSSQGEG